MQCSITVERDRASGNKMKNSYKNPYRKESNLDNIVDQLCTRLQDIKDQEDRRVGMPTATLEHSEAVRRYYAAFPALKKGQESPLQYYLPPPVWCRKPATPRGNMHSEPANRDWSANKNKKFSTGKERRNSYHGQKKSKKRCGYSRSFDKQSLPEWVTSEGVWDMDAQDPVKEFIRAIALDEGYATCENTVVDELKDISQARDNRVPDWDDSLDLESEWVIDEDLKPKVRTPMEEELYAKFEAKFDRSIEALWAKEQNTPDDEYQDLPIDFQDLLSSPSDHLFADPSAEKCSLISLTESIWSNDGQSGVARQSPTRSVDGLHDRFKPLNLADAPEPAPTAPTAPAAPIAPREIESFALYEGEDVYDALSTVADTLRSFTAINHSRDCSGFVEVPPRRRRAERAVGAGAAGAAGGTAGGRAASPPRDAPRSREDLLTSARTHFRPIRREAETEARYADGDTFDIRGDLEPVELQRSASGGLFVGRTRVLEYRAAHTIDYTRLNLTAAQRCPDLEDPGFRLRFPVRQSDVAVQTDREDSDAWGACDECGRTAKKMRPSAIDSIWAGGGCSACRAPAPPPAALPAPPAHPAPAARDELSREWEELLSDISAAHQEYLRADVLEDTLLSADRKRRHSAARDGAPLAAAAAACSHPHARFLHCCASAADRPLTR